MQAAHQKSNQQQHYVHKHPDDKLNMVGFTGLQVVFLTGIYSVNSIYGFCTHAHVRVNNHRPITFTTTGLNSFSYGRGAEIWPATNEDAVLLSDTFPNGQIPYSAVVTIEQQDMASVHEAIEETINGTTTVVNDNATSKRRSKRKFVSRSIRRILRRAAAKEELDSEGEMIGLDRTPIVVATTLLARGLVRPLDVTLISFLTSYLTILSMVARRPRENGGAPILPALPPQSHVPVIVSNPMGVGIQMSRLYDAWLKLGVILGFVGPILLLTRYILFENNLVAAKACSRPLFLLCCQAVTESISRKLMVSRSFGFSEHYIQYFLRAHPMLMWILNVVAPANTNTYPNSLQHCSTCFSVVLGNRFSPISGTIRSLPCRCQCGVLDNQSVCLSDTSS